MKNLILFTTTFFLFFGSCNQAPVDPNAPVEDPKGVDPLTISRKITDGWSKAKGLGGGRNYSFKNHLYQFTVEKDNSVVDFLLESTEIDIGFAIYNELGQEIAEQQGDRSEKSQQKLNSGKYSILVYSSERNAIGNYILTITGIPKIQSRVKSDWIKSIDQSFGDDGGGGEEYSGAYRFKENSSKNKYYTFEINQDNAIVDIELEANTADCFFALYNENEEFVDFIYSRRYDFQIFKLNKGKYKLWVGTKLRYEKTNFGLNIYGHVSNLSKVEFTSFKFKGSWPKKETLETYKIEIENDNSFIDINLSNNYEGNFVLYDSNHSPISPYSNFSWENYGKNSGYHILVKKGIYELNVNPFPDSRLSFTNTYQYTLDVVGNVKSVSKK